MMLPEDGTLLRIFIGESERHDGLPVVDAAIPEGLVTLEKVQVRLYRSGAAKAES